MNQVGDGPFQTAFDQSLGAAGDLNLTFFVGKAEVVRDYLDRFANRPLFDRDSQNSWH
jgi:hypothetical protein